MVVRYMGTKRHMVDHVRTALESLHPQGRVVDLFSGMGSVAESLRDSFPVVTNDVLGFTATISRARFVGMPRTGNADEVLARLRPVYLAQLAELSARFGEQLAMEHAALGANRETLVAYMANARHVGNDRHYVDAARMASEDASVGRYCLASLYFSAGYFGLRQAVEIDSLRSAIDALSQPHEQDWLLGAWLVALAVLANAPGHTAQFLKPNSPTGHARIVRTWKRSVWHQFASSLDSLRQVGSAKWRNQNEVFVSDALDLVNSPALSNVGAFYADPPYTKDQYSRYYHVYETLYRYDFPDCKGAGRNRSDRVPTGFSLKSLFVSSFHDLCRSVARRQVPLVVSYPTHGLLQETGWSLRDIVSEYFSRVDVLSIDARHSTMGASKGSPRKPATENLYVCQI